VGDSPPRYGERELEVLDLRESECTGKQWQPRQDGYRHIFPRWCAANPFWARAVVGCTPTQLGAALPVPYGEIH